MTVTPHFRNALQTQSMLLEYRIEQVLGVGGFGITYRARDVNLDKDVALKEYLPGELAMRTPEGKVVAQATTHEAGYRWGLDRFLLEARTLAKFSHPHIVRVLRYFEANDTAYMVMDYEEGDPLKAVLQLDPQPSEAKLKSIIAPLLDGLAAVHAAGFLHRDIKPDNIFVRADGSPVLIDFGSARQALGSETRSLTAVLTPGFAPLEQYSGEGRQGPWTDLYAMGGVLYRAVVGKNPPDAVTRVRGDALATGVSASLAGVRDRYSESFLNAIEWALAMDEARRPQSVLAWKGALLEANAGKTLVATEATAVDPAAQIPESKGSEPIADAPRKKCRRWPYVVVAVCVVLALLAAGAWRKHRLNRQETRPNAVQSSAVKSEPSAAPAAARGAAVEAAGPPRSAAATEPAAEPTDATLAEARQRFRREAEAEFRSADANGDGYLSLEEARRRFPAQSRGFARADRDGDGRISLTEFTAAKRAVLQRRLRKQSD